MKASYIIVFFCCILETSYAQKNYLNINLKGQLQSNWCGATSIQMVLDYHGKTVSQCDIQKTFFTKNASIFTLDLKGLSSSTCDCNQASLHKYDKPIFDNKLDIQNILGQYNFSAIEEPPTSFNWLSLREQIDNKMPFIIEILRNDKILNSKTGTFDPNPNNIDNNHYQVVDGYISLNIQNCPIQFALMKDPWGGNGNVTCSGCKYAVPMNILTTVDHSKSIGQVVSWIHTIYDKQQANPLQHTQAIASNFALLNQNYLEQGKDSSALLNKQIDWKNPISITETYYQALKRQVPEFFEGLPAIDNPTFQKVDVDEISYNKILLNCDGKFTNSPFVEGTRSVVFSENFPQFQVALLKSTSNTSAKDCPGVLPFSDGSFYSVKSITQCPFITKLGANTAGGIDVTLPSGLPQKTMTIGTPANPFHLMNYPEFNYSFLTFTFQGQKYCVSQKDIATLKVKKSSVLANHAYLQSDILGAIHQETQVYDMKIRKNINK